MCVCFHPPSFSYWRSFDIFRTFLVLFPRFLSISYKHAFSYFSFFFPPHSHTQIHSYTDLLPKPITDFFFCSLPTFFFFFRTLSSCWHDTVVLAPSPVLHIFVTCCVRLLSSQPLIFVRKWRGFGGLFFFCRRLRNRKWRKWGSWVRYR